MGSSVAANLASEANDITLVDTKTELLDDLRDRLDIQTVTGHASSPRVLENAGIEDADMLIAVIHPQKLPAFDQRHIYSIASCLIIKQCQWMF